jgi:MFS family permease
VGVYSAVALAVAMAAMLGVGAISDSFDRRVISIACLVSLGLISLVIGLASYLESVCAQPFLTLVVN